MVLYLTRNPLNVNVSASTEKAKFLWYTDKKTEDCAELLLDYLM